MKAALKRSSVMISLFLIGLFLTSVTIWLLPEIRAFSFNEPYLPHGFCFMWNRHLLALHVIADTLIGISYFTISAMLTVIAFQNRRLIPFRWMFLSFGSFIVACGITHFFEVFVLWHPYYWLEGEMKLVTAAISLFTACLLPPLAPRIRALLLDAENTRKAEQQREQAYTFARTIVESSAFTIIVTDLKGNITAANPAAGRLLWYTPGEMLQNRAITSLFDPQELTSERDARAAEFNEEIASPFDTLTVKIRKGLLDEKEWVFIRKDDVKIPVHVTVTSLRGTSNDDGYMFTAFDITERLRSQEYIRHIATHDSLTGLPSRLLFRDRLEVALARAKRFGEHIAILMVDLDNFKRINDSLGHHAGDEALVVIAQRLRAAVRKTDTVARMGGDEFMVILCDVREKMVDSIAENILHSLVAPISLGSHEVHITASIGVCSEVRDGDPVALLKHADLALYRSKAEGKNQINRYSADMTHASVERLQMETSLRAAVQKQELHLQFQPQVSLATGQMTGIEALVRWPRDGDVHTMPGQFIPLAEETGLIVPIGEWVLTEACEKGMQLSREVGREITVAVNISPRQFKDRGVFHAVRNALDQSQLPPNCLELEITESVLMQGSQETLEGLTRIRELGVRIALDDFGTGFSSMSYITRFAIDRIKIDQSFVRGVISEPNSRAVITAIIAMAHGLGITVIAEGTETREEVEALKTMQCDEAQGYFFSRPVDSQYLQDLFETIPSL